MTWKHGLTLYQQQKFYEAHEAWECEWKRTTDEGLRKQIQAWIMICGMFVLIEKGRTEAATRLRLRAIELLEPGAHPEALHYLRTLDWNGLKSYTPSSPSRGSI